MATLQSPLEHQYSMLTDLITVADDIISQQTEIKLKTERMKLKNEELQTKSRELQEVLKTSQEQLLSDTSIPIELINQLAVAVRNMKESHQSEFQDLIGLFSNVQRQFEKQQKVFEASVVGEKPEERREEKEEELRAGSEAGKERNSDSGAFKQTKKDDGKLKSNVTILQVSEGTKPCSASVDSPASHSEVVSSDLLASLTRNADKGKPNSEEAAEAESQVLGSYFPDLPHSV